MDIQNLANVSTVVINSLLMILKDNHIDVNSVVMQLSNNKDEAISPEVNLGELIQQTINELQEAKAQKVAVPEGFVLVDKSKTEHWYLDEGEYMWMEEPDNWLCDMDIGEVQAVEHKEYLVTESNTLYATKVWDDENGDVDTWQFFKSQDEAEKAAAYCKAKFWEEEAQEQTDISKFDGYVPMQSRSKEPTHD